MRAALRLSSLALLVGLGAAISPDGFAQDGDEPPPPTEPGPGAPPPPGDPTKDGDGVQQPLPDRPEDAPKADAKPKGSEGKPTGAVLITFEREVPPVGDGVTTQEEIEDKEHVTFKGTAKCEGCDGSLLLMIERKTVPNDKVSQIVTTKTLTEPGDFTLLVPEMTEAVILHLVVDTDNSGGPTRGERSAMLELGGALVPSADREGLVLDGTAEK